MGYKTVFCRYESKYLISAEQKQRLLLRMSPYVREDAYGRSTVRSLYYDDEGCRLIRRSMEKPLYKEKLRLRAYRQVGAGDAVFAEIKKKYNKVVFKRRIALPEAQATAWLGAGGPAPEGQIAREISRFCEFYGPLAPTVLLSCEREAYCAEGINGLRITFDERVLARTEGLSLREAVGGEALLGEGEVLMELKSNGGLPLWMVAVLREEGIYRISFSKYARAYERLIFPKLYGGERHA